MNGVGIVIDLGLGRYFGARSRDPPGQLRAEGVPHPTSLGHTLGQELIAEQQQRHTWPANDLRRVVSGGGQKSSQRRGDVRARPRDDITHTALLAGRTDVGTHPDIARHRPLAGRGVFPSQDGIGSGRNHGPGCDPDGFPGLEHLLPRVPGSDIADDPPRTLS